MIDPFYNDYFEDLARRHPQLLHGPNKRHFWHLADAEALSDLQTAFKSDLYPPALVLHPYTNEPSIESDNCREQINGAFSILLAANPSDPVEQRIKRDQARIIANSILAKMRGDKMPGGALHDQKIMLDPRFPGLDEPQLFGQVTGWTYEFSWLLPMSMPNPTW
jgi:hypothetical protein